MRHIWQIIAEAGFKSPMLDAGYRPHVSLGVYDSDLLDLHKLRHKLTAFANTLSSFSIDLSNIGIFPTAESVFFLGATVTQKLLEVHANFHATFESFSASLRSYYQVGNWVPHCTLAYGLMAEERAAVIPICWEISLPLQAKVEKIGLTKTSPINCKFIIQHRL